MFVKMNRSPAIPARYGKWSVMRAATMKEEEKKNYRHASAHAAPGRSIYSVPTAQIGYRAARWKRKSGTNWQHYENEMHYQNSSSLTHHYHWHFPAGYVAIALLRQQHWHYVLAWEMACLNAAPHAGH
jgi:hypothetical protein